MFTLSLVWGVLVIYMVREACLEMESASLYVVGRNWGGLCFGRKLGSVQFEVIR